MAAPISVFSSDDEVVVGTTSNTVVVEPLTIGHGGSGYILRVYKKMVHLVGKRAFALQNGKVYFFKQGDGELFLARMVKTEESYFRSDPDPFKLVVQLPRTGTGQSVYCEELQIRLPSITASYEYLGKQPKPW